MLKGQTVSADTVPGFELTTLWSVSQNTESDFQHPFLFIYCKRDTLFSLDIGKLTMLLSSKIAWL